MSAQKTIVREISFFAHFGVQNLMVHEFLKYLRIIVQKYVIKYQLFSTFRIMLMLHEYLLVREYINCVAVRK